MYRVVCSHKYLSKCLERKKLRWRLKHILRTDSLYNCELNKNELYMFFPIKRGEVIFFVSFKRIPYWYHPSVLNKTSDNDKITFTIQSNFKPPWNKELKHWLTCLWVWAAIQQHQCLLYHTLARCLCWTSSEAGFKHGSAVIGLIEVISCKFVLNWFSKAGHTEHVFKCSVSAHLLTIWKDCCKLNGVHHCRNSLQIGQELRQTLVLKPTLYPRVQLWGLGDFVCSSGRFLDSGCSWKNPLAGRAAELAGFSSAVLGQVVHPRLLASESWERLCSRIGLFLSSFLFVMFHGSNTSLLSHQTAVGEEASCPVCVVHLKQLYMRGKPGDASCPKKGWGWCWGIPKDLLSTHTAYVALFVSSVLSADLCLDKEFEGKLPHLGPKSRVSIYSE